MLVFLADLTPASAVCLAVSLFAGSLVPFFLLVDVDRLMPRIVRDLPDVVRPLARDAAVSLAALCMLLDPTTTEVSR